jgi:hypothetical protein
MRLSISKLCVVVSLSVGRMPRIAAMLELLHTPSIAHVLLTRRRRLSYSDFFTPLDRDGRRAAPIKRASTSVPGDEGTADAAPAPQRYIPVDAA